MKRVMYVAAAAIACTVTASAQTGMGADKMGQDKMAKDAPKTMMVTGCVAESDGKFMLNNAMMSTPGMAGGAATGGGSMAGGAATGGGAPMAGGGGMAGGGAMAGGAPAMSYMLSGGTLKPHVGHKVEVTGMMKPMDKGAMGKDMPKDSMASGAMGKDGMKGPMETIDVKAVKMIAATCS